MADPGDVIQVCMLPGQRRMFEQFLALRGMRLMPIPNGRDADGKPVLDSPDDLATFIIAREEGGNGEH